MIAPRPIEALVLREIASCRCIRDRCDLIEAAGREALERRQIDMIAAGSCDLIEVYSTEFMARTVSWMGGSHSGRVPSFRRHYYDFLEVGTVQHAQPTVPTVLAPRSRLVEAGPRRCVCRVGS